MKKQNILGSLLVSAVSAVALSQFSVAADKTTDEKAYCAKSGCSGANGCEQKIKAKNEKDCVAKKGTWKTAKTETTTETAPATTTESTTTTTETAPAK